eukprot:5050280-Prymnesium_polylepis.1
MSSLHRSVSQQERRLAISKSAAMVVIMHDETHLSDQCRFEWRVARELQLPVKVVLDVERCGDPQAVHKAVRAQHPNLWEQQPWGELADRCRQDCVTEVGTFLEAATDSSDSFVGASSGTPLCFSDGEQVMHDVFEALLTFGGVPYRTPDGLLPRAWCAFVAFGWPVCLSMSVVRLAYARGPTFTDVQSALTVVVFHAFIFYAPVRLNDVLRSESLLKMLSSLEGSTNLERGARLHEQTKGAGIAIFGACACLVAATYAAYLPLFFDPFYVGPEARLFDQAFGWLSGVAFICLIPPIEASFFASMALMFMLLSLSRMQLEASFDSLSLKVAQVGLHRLMTIKSEQGLALAPTNSNLTAFNRAWITGLEHYRAMQRELALVQLLGLLCAGVAMTTPFELLALGFDFDESVHWAHAIRLGAIVTALGPLTLACILWPA